MRKFYTICRMAILVGLLSSACLGEVVAQETEAQRMAWWRDAQFGMFIHWGLYAIPAGFWPLNGGIDYNTSEWIMAAANIPITEYEGLVNQFNPQVVQGLAAEWVHLAKDAGMRYLIITAKHHDGFSMWPTNFVDQANPVLYSLTPDKDILKALSDECAKQGIRFGVYYSILDWHHSAFHFPDGCSGEWCYTAKSLPDATKANYVSYMKSQLKELITNYNPGIIWFDGSWAGNWTSSDGNDLFNYVRSLNSDIIVNDRTGGDPPPVAGDFSTFEGYIPDTDPGGYWETPMTMNNNWGYKSNDDHWKSPETLMHDLIEIMSKGGNYLLNVGPTADGTIPQPSVDRLASLGEWQSAPALIQSNFGQRGNFEMLIRQGGQLCHYWRDNDAAGFPWHPDPVAQEASDCFGENIEFAPAFIQDRPGGDFGQKGNFEVVVPQWDPDKQVTMLCHYWRVNDAAPGEPYEWHPDPAAQEAPDCFAVGIESAPTLIQSDFGQQGNFEVVVQLVQQGGQLCHYWRDNDDPNYPWSQQPTACFAADVTSAPALIQSNFGYQGDFEVVARRAGQLCHFWRNNDAVGYPWQEPDPLTQCFGEEVTSAPALIQSRGLSSVGNFEVVFREGTLLRHYFRNNDTDQLWYESEPPFGEEVSSAPALYQSRNLGAIGNFEVVVREAPSEEVGDPVHIWRDNNTFFPDFYPWYQAETVQTVSVPPPE